MIVVSNNLVLSSELIDAPNANNPIVGWDNRVTLSGISASFEDISFPAANLSNPSTYYRWQSTDPDDVQFLTVTNLGEEQIDYLAVAAHNLGSTQTPVRVQGDSGSGFVDLTSDVLLPDDAPVIFRFTPVGLTSIRLRMAPAGDILRASVLYTGKLLVLQRRIYVGHAPLTHNRSTTKIPSTSESGHFLGTLVTRRANSTRLDLKNITPEFFRNDMVPWLRFAETSPFFFAWRPGDYPLETGYCWLPSSEQVSNAMANGLMQVTANLQGFIGQ
jgi:hypothetical protein